MDRAALRTEISFIHHEVVRISSHLEHASTKLEMKNTERAKYFMDWSRKELEEVLQRLKDVDKQFFKEEASDDAIPKQTA